MAETPRHPLLNPVLRFTKEAKPEGITGGGKTARGIKTERLAGQRRALAAQFAGLAAQAAQRPRFDGRLILCSAMFDDSLAPTWAPSDLFQATRAARLVAPYRTGYLVEIAADQLSAFARLVQRTDHAKDEVDISRVECVRFFADEDAAGASSLEAIWRAAPETDAGRAFVVWLMPLRGRDAAEQLIQAFSALRDGTIAPPPPLLDSVAADLDANVPAIMRRNLRAAATAGDRFNLAVREYRLRRRARTTVIVPTPAALQQLVASGPSFESNPCSRSVPPRPERVENRTALCRPTWHRTRSLGSLTAACPPVRTSTRKPGARHLSCAISLRIHSTATASPRSLSRAMIGTTISCCRLFIVGRHCAGGRSAGRTVLC
jgi:hypothetical protein